MKFSIKPRQASDTTCFHCGAEISQEAASAHMRICLICYARQLNNRFRENRILTADESEREEREKLS